MIKNVEIHPVHDPTLTWDRFVWEGYLKIVRSQWRGGYSYFPVNHYMYAGPKGRLLVDEMLSYENLEVELMRLAERLGLPLSGLHAREKSGIREKVKVSNLERRIIYHSFRQSQPYTGYKLRLEEE